MAAISALLSFILVSAFCFALSKGQKFQYSKGWMPGGKRAFLQNGMDIRSAFREENGKPLKKVSDQLEFSPSAKSPAVYLLSRLYARHKTSSAPAELRLSRKQMAPMSGPISFHNQFLNNVRFLRG